MTARKMYITASSGYLGNAIDQHLASGAYDKDDLPVADDHVLFEFLLHARRVIKGALGSRAADKCQALLNYEGIPAEMFSPYANRASSKQEKLLPASYNPAIGPEHFLLAIFISHEVRLFECIVQPRLT
jgi:hypothetical protein